MVYPVCDQEWGAVPIYPQRQTACGYAYIRDCYRRGMSARVEEKGNVFAAQLHHTKPEFDPKIGGCYADERDMAADTGDALPDCDASGDAFFAVATEGCDAVLFPEASAAYKSGVRTAFRTVRSVVMPQHTMQTPAATYIQRGRFVPTVKG